MKEQRRNKTDDLETMLNEISENINKALPDLEEIFKDLPDPKEIFGDFKLDLDQIGKEEV